MPCWLSASNYFAIAHFASYSAGIQWYCVERMIQNLWNSAHVRCDVTDGDVDLRPANGPYLQRRRPSDFAPEFEIQISDALAPIVDHPSYDYSMAEAAVHAVVSSVAAIDFAYLALMRSMSVLSMAIASIPIYCYHYLIHLFRFHFE